MRFRGEFTNFNFADLDADGCQVIEFLFLTTPSKHGLFGVEDIYNAIPSQSGEANFYSTEGAWATLTMPIDTTVAQALIDLGWFADPQIQIFMGMTSESALGGTDGWICDLAKVHYVYP